MRFKIRFFLYLALIIYFLSLSTVRFFRQSDYEKCIENLDFNSEDIVNCEVAPNLFFYTREIGLGEFREINLIKKQDLGNAFNYLKDSSESSRIYFNNLNEAKSLGSYSESKFFVGNVDFDSNKEVFTYAYGSDFKFSIVQVNGNGEVVLEDSKFTFFTSIVMVFAPIISLILLAILMLDSIITAALKK